MADPKKIWVHVLPRGSKALGYFQTHFEWIDQDGTFRKHLSEIPRERRHDALGIIFKTFPRMQADWYRAFEDLVADIDMEELERTKGRKAMRQARGLLARIGASR